MRSQEPRLCSRRQMHMYLRWLIPLALLATACTSPDPVAEDGQATVGSEASFESEASLSTLLFAEPEELGAGVILPTLGPVDPGVLVETEWLDSDRDADDRLSAAWNSCRKLAPGRWVLEGEVFDSYDFPLVVDAAFVRTHEDSVRGNWVEAVPVRLTFSAAGAFTLVYDVTTIEPGPDARSVMQSDNGVDACGLKQGTLVPTEITTHIPSWTAPADSVQGYPLTTPIANTDGLQAALATDVWLGNGYSFATIWLPENPFAYTDLVVTGDPGCPTLSYGVRIPQLRLFEVFVEHRGGSCFEVETVLGHVEGREGWEWIDNYQTTAQIAMGDGWLRVRAENQATVIATIDDLRPFANLLTLPRSEESSTAAPIETRPLGWHRNFGANDEQCESTVIEIDQDYQFGLANGQKCFLAQVNDGVPVVWDLVFVTVHGDPIFTRHVFDGEAIWFLRDVRADKYDSPSVTAQACHDVDLNTLAYEGSGCEPSDYPGFSGFAEAD